MKRLALGLLLVVALVAVPTLASGPAKATAANKNVAADNTLGVSGSLDTGTVLATASLAKLHKHNVLTISGAGSTVDPCTFEIVPVVNGIQGVLLGLTPAHGDLKFSGALGQTVSSTWGLDVDAIEADNPGVFANKPLTVDLQVTNFSRTADPSTFNGTLVIRQDKR